MHCSSFHRNKDESSIGEANLCNWKVSEIEVSIDLEKKTQKKPLIEKSKIISKQYQKDLRKGLNTKRYFNYIDMTFNVFHNLNPLISCLC